MLPSPACTGGVQPNPDLTELDVGGVRHGTDLTVMLGGQPLRLLSVHLKSFCHQDDLDNVSPTSNSDCGKLKQQIPILESWIEARAQEGVPLVVLGDFNRRFNIAEDDMWRELDDGDPDLTKHTEDGMSACMNFRFPEYIDHIVTDTRSTALVRPASFEQLLFTTVDPGGDADLSDHCPIAVVFETDGAIEPSDAIAVLVDRLDAVQAELQGIRAALKRPARVGAPLAGRQQATHYREGMLVGAHGCREWPATTSGRRRHWSSWFTH